MVKIISSFFCQNCGAESAKWVGKCPSCGEWNTMVEEVVSKGGKDEYGQAAKKPGKNSARSLSEIEPGSGRRFLLKDQEFNRVLGGGLVPGSLILVGGEPGIGKSTLMLQTALQNEGLKTLYVSGEESGEQIRMRAERLGMNDGNCLIYTETSTQQILQTVKQHQPDLLIIDSIQTLHSEYIDSSPGSISQIRESASEMMNFAKKTQTPVFLIGHITKEGSLAGPKVLEHMVDTVIQFEGDRHHIYRLLRSVKNRFGSTNELGIYEMQGSGLREVDNPSEILIGQGGETLSGTAVASTLEGLRPLLIEVQALVSTAAYGTPQRSATGFDLRRLNMLLAVLEKRCGFRLGAKDVFLNLAGGVKMDDPAIDLAVIAAILSSGEDLPVARTTAFAGEVGLSGEIRPVTRVDQRISEADKLGFDRMFISSYNKGIDPKKYKLELVMVTKVEEVFNRIFG
ncbi:DNA repair protein RadA [Halocola ammonii]